MSDSLDPSEEVEMAAIVPEQVEAMLGVGGEGEGGVGIGGVGVGGVGVGPVESPVPA